MTVNDRLALLISSNGSISLYPHGKLVAKTRAHFRVGEAGLLDFAASNK